MQIKLNFAVEYVLNAFAMYSVVDLTGATKKTQWNILQLELKI